MLRKVCRDALRRGTCADTAPPLCPFSLLHSALPQAATWAAAAGVFYVAIYRPEERRRAQRRGPAVLTFPDEPPRIDKGKPRREA